MTQPSPSRPAWVSCSRARLRSNLGLLAGAVGGPGRVLAVLKAAAYGHGAVEAARTLAAGGVGRFGVATLEEAVALRRAGVGGTLLLLGPLEARHIAEARRWRVSLTAWNLPWLDDASRALKSGRVGVHIKADTGMMRLGFLPAEVPEVLQGFASGRWRNLPLEGAYTHLACADERGDRATPGQLRAFGALPWPPGLPLHAANSAAALRYPAARLDFVRSGMLLYGCLDPSLSPRARLQEPVLRAYATVLRVAPLAAGQGVSYGHRFTATRAMRVATVCAGYADGVPRALGGRGSVAIRGRRCRILGRVCMDLFMADVSRVPGARAGDTVTLLEGGSGPCSARAWAEAAGTNAYEILCRLAPRLPRVWGD